MFRKYECTTSIKQICLTNTNPNGGNSSHSHVQACRQNNAFFLWPTHWSTSKAA
jgi:hypothetical protein